MWISAPSPSRYSCPPVRSVLTCYVPGNVPLPPPHAPVFVVVQVMLLAVLLPTQVCCGTPVWGLIVTVGIHSESVMAASPFLLGVNQPMLLGGQCFFFCGDFFAALFDGLAHGL
jgi:hypothetical protein